MEYISTLNNIYKSDIKSAGRRAVDLATLSRKRFEVPLGFVLKAEALEEFVAHNQLQEKGAEYLADEDYESLRQEALHGDIPRKILNEIREAYETLSVDEEGGASDIVDSEQEPYVTLIPSPDHALPGRHYEGIFQNVKGLNQLIEGIKMAWASLFTQEAFEHRNELGVKEFHSGLIVQKMPKSETSATATAEQDEEEVEVQTWFGFPEYDMGLEKDKFRITKTGLQIRDHDVNHQVKRIIRDEEGKLDQIAMGDRGEQQKIDDKTVIELARLAKKASNELGNGVENYYTLDKEDTMYLLMTNRIDQGEEQSDEDVSEEESFEASEPEPETEDEFKPPEPEEDVEASEPEESSAEELSKEDRKDFLNTPVEEMTTGEEQEEDEQDTFMSDMGGAAVPEEDEGLPDFGSDGESIEWDEEPSEEYSEAPSEEPDEAMEQLRELKDMVYELDSLVKDGSGVDVRHKLNEIDQTIKKLRDHHN